MATHVFDPAAFRLIFPAFANTTVFPDVRLQAYWDLAVTYMGDVDGPLLAGPSMQSALNFLTAHLLAIAVMLEKGQTTAYVTGATVDKVSVTAAPPPWKSGWQWWLCLTPYGAQLWALLSAKSAGGFFVPGNPERFAFRRVGGGFGPGPFG